MGGLGFLVSWFRSFLVSKLLGFKVDWLLDLRVPLLLDFRKCWFQSFKDVQIAIACFLEDIDPISTMLTILLNGSYHLSVPELSNVLKLTISHI